MNINRRSFLGYCIGSAAVLGLSQFDLFKLKSALAKSDAPKVIWLQGAGCSGCSVSFLNYFSQPTSADPIVTTATVLTDDIDLVYHPTLMAAAGQMASDAAVQASNSGSFILVVEGGVPTAFGGNCAIAWSRSGTDVTFQDAVKDFAGRASAVVAVGTCASFGGVSAAAPNPGGVVPVSKAINKATINIPGCPAHPDWVVWAIVQLLSGNTVAMDGLNRPTGIYGKEVHANCPRNAQSVNTLNPNDVRAQTFGEANQACLLKLGCSGPGTYAPCPTMKWNNGVNWCVDANSPCLGCTQPTFPDAGDFYNVHSS